MDTLEVRVLQRYFRKTSAHPEGSVVHHGDCDFFSLSVCTCGLHHDLRGADPGLVDRLYPLLPEELGQFEKARASYMEEPRERRTRKK